MCKRSDIFFEEVSDFITYRTQNTTAVCACTSGWYILRATTPPLSSFVRTTIPQKFLALPLLVGFLLLGRFRRLPNAALIAFMPPALIAFMPPAI